MNKGDLVYQSQNKKRLFVITDIEPNLPYPMKDRIKAVCVNTTKKFTFIKSDLEQIKNEYR